MKRRWLRAALVVLVAGATCTTVLVGPAAAHSAFCQQRWGSTAEQAGGSVSARVTEVRAGRHACFDRLVVDLQGRPPAYRAEYVSAIVQDGSGKVVAVRGGARLQIVLNAAAHDDDGRSTLRTGTRRELVSVSGYRTLRQVALVGDFEGLTTIGVGVRARLPFRVFTLPGPRGGSRLVIDVGHRW